MKFFRQMLTVLFCVALFAQSCKKDEVKLSSLTSLTVTNAVVGGASVRVGSNATTVANNNFAQLALIAGVNDLYVWPVTDST